MRFIFLIIITFLLTSQSKAQIGFHGAYTTLDAAKWKEDITRSYDLTLNGYKAGVNYWFRLKNKRIEFLPELSFSNYTNEIASIGFNHQMLRFQLALPVLIYPFDFNGDCNCPTWSKQNKLFKKGLFFEFTPNVNSNNQSLKRTVSVTSEPSYDKINISSIGAGFRLGIGLDIGVSDLITLTPYYRYGFDFGNDYFKFVDVANAIQNNTVFAESNLTKIKSEKETINEMGLRIGMRFDYHPKYHRRR
ncbi:MAG: hypothetical protein KBA06_06025 [Saprospiraceae bacterium]|nr:hypothetical protein [Saprospiraceae bacterium]